VQVVPLTSNTKRLYPSEALVQVAGATNKAMANQITTVATERILGRVSALSERDLLAVERIIKIQLGLA
jgi:mRNA interferase MazF